MVLKPSIESSAFFMFFSILFARKKSLILSPTESEPDTFPGDSDVLEEPLEEFLFRLNRGFISGLLHGSYPFLPPSA